MPAKITLSVVEGNLSGTDFVFEDRTSCIMGRGRGCEPKLPNDPEHRRVSRNHCLLDINPPDIRIRDFGSLNGTYVNGEKIGQREKDKSAKEGAAEKFPEYDLKHGDRITLGETVLEVSVYTPAICVDCSAEIPEEKRAVTQVADDLYQCEECKRKVKAMGQTDAPKAKPMECSKCGRNVEGEVGDNRRGQYVCLSCREDPKEILMRLLTLAKSGRKELQPINGYTIERELARGGMGAVYLAREDGTEKSVALKVMLPQVAADDRATQKFLLEAVNTQALDHANVVKTYDSGCSEGTFFFTMEYCNGGSIDSLLKQRGGPLSIDEALPLMFQLLDGLDYAHQALIPKVRLNDGSYRPGKGLVHRDLKPQNILLHSSYGNLVVKVADFGLGKAFDLAGLSGQTSTGAVAGTPVFMARQQVRRFKYAKPDVDVWAAAATFYFLLTGELVREFELRKGAKKDIWDQILSYDAVPIRKVNPNIPKRLAEVIDTALREEPKIGFSTAAELKRGLEDAQ